MLPGSYRQRQVCPWCIFAVDVRGERDQYILREHIELFHREYDEPSPFQVRYSDAAFTAHARDVLPANFEPISAWDNDVERQRNDLEGATLHNNNEQVSRYPQHAESSESDYVNCPCNCGEAVHIEEIAYHMEMHDVEGLILDDSGRPTYERESSSARPTPCPSSSSLSSIEKLSTSKNTRSFATEGSPSQNIGSHVKERLSEEAQWTGVTPAQSVQPEAARSSHPGIGIRRLGKRELGPFAFEQRMPTWLYRQLTNGAKIVNQVEVGPYGQHLQTRRPSNETPGIVPVLAQLCEQDTSISEVYLCHPSVRHIFKTYREGGFCGYRNIQMLISFLQETRGHGHHHFVGSTPSVLRLQDLIEEAWDKGFNATGRIETGGVRGTRKYIGTPEAQALFSSLDIPCEANAFNVSMDQRRSGALAHDAVIQAVYDYFSSRAHGVPRRVYQTDLAPIYFQRPGHSLTIVGLEIRKSGTMNLLVFDPMFNTVPGIVKLIGSSFRATEPGRLLKAFRRGSPYLSKYNSFEILKLLNPFGLQD